MNKKVYSITINGLKQSVEDTGSLEQNLSKLNEELTKTTQAEKTRSTQVDKLTKLQAELNNYSKDYQLNLAKTKASLSELNKLTQQEIALEQAKKTVQEKNLSSYVSKQKYLTSLGTVIKNYVAATDEELHQLDQLKVEYSNLNNELKAFDAEMSNHQRNIGNYEGSLNSLDRNLGEVGDGFVDVMMDIGKLEDELYSMRTQGVDPTSDKFRDLQSRIVGLKTVVQDTDGEIDRMSNRFRGLNDTLNVARGGLAIFGLWEGSMAALGIESQEFEKTMQKVAGVMVLLNSLQEIQGMLADRTNIIYIGLNKTLKAFGVNLDNTLSSNTKLSDFSSNYDTAGNRVINTNQAIVASNQNVVNSVANIADATGDFAQLSQTSKLIDVTEESNQLKILSQQLGAITSQLNTAKAAESVANDVLNTDNLSSEMFERAAQAQEAAQKRSLELSALQADKQKEIDNYISGSVESQNQLTTATQATTKATKGLSTVWKALGVGLGLAALGIAIDLIIKNWSKLNKLFRNTNAPFEKWGKDLELVNKDLERFLILQEDIQDIRVIMDTDDVEIANKRIEYLEEALRRLEDAKIDVDFSISDIPFNNLSSAEKVGNGWIKVFTEIAKIAGYIGVGSVTGFNTTAAIFTKNVADKIGAQKAQQDLLISLGLTNEEYEIFNAAMGENNQLTQENIDKFNELSFEDRTKALEEYISANKDNNKVSKETIFTLEQYIIAGRKELELIEELRDAQIDLLNVQKTIFSDQKAINDQRLNELEDFYTRVAQMRRDEQMTILEDEKSGIVGLPILTDRQLNESLDMFDTNYKAIEQIRKANQAAEKLALEESIKNTEFVNNQKSLLNKKFVEDYNDQIYNQLEELKTNEDNWSDERIEAEKLRLENNLILQDENGYAVVTKTQYTLAAMAELNEKFRIEDEQSLIVYNKERVSLTEDGNNQIIAKNKEFDESIKAQLQENTDWTVNEVTKTADRISDAYDSIIKTQVESIDLGFTSLPKYFKYLKDLREEEAKTKQVLYQSITAKTRAEKEMAQEIALNPENEEAIKAQFQPTLNGLNNTIEEATNRIEEIPNEIEATRAQLIIGIGDIINELGNYVSETMGLVSDFMDFEIELLEDDLGILEDQLTKATDAVQDSQDRILSLNEQLADSYGERRDEIAQALADEEALLIERYHIEEKLEREKAALELEIENKKKEQQKLDLQANLVTALTNTAVGVTQALATAPPYSYILAGITAAMGAAQVAIINKQINSIQYEDGGLLNGPSHSQGGIQGTGTFSNIEVEGGEYIINKVSTAKYLPLIESINNDDVTITNQPSLADMLVDIDFQPVVSVTDINRVNTRLTKVKGFAGK